MHLRKLATENFLKYAAQLTTDDSVFELKHLQITL
jgi:hypothetical protein